MITVNLFDTLRNTQKGSQVYNLELHGPFLQVMLFYSSLCEEGPQYGNKLIEKFGVCGFLDKILCDVKVDSRSYFPLSCLVGEVIKHLYLLPKRSLFCIQLYTTDLTCGQSKPINAVKEFSLSPN